MNENVFEPDFELSIEGDSSYRNGKVTFYADTRSPRSKMDRRQCRERRKAIRFTPDRRNNLDRRQQTMTWNNGYQFQNHRLTPDF
ncbi:MAG: hypothetical protein AseanaTS_11490 [Candidatus Pelagadaptatus aseana]|uniref:hypothetical protein n=1 Tax=Candidatus Pelagadaptatus aseana TaxID=3120508 RepID=UPI0039B27267